MASLTERHCLGFCMVLFIRALWVRAPAYLAGQTERSKLKLLSRGEERSPLKYIINVLLSDFEYFIKKKVGLSTRIWISILGKPKLLSKGQTFGTKSAKNYCHVGTLETFHLWNLATSVKAQRSTFGLSTNHVTGFPSPLNQPVKCEDP